MILDVSVNSCSGIHHLKREITASEPNQKSSDSWFSLQFKRPHPPLTHSYAVQNIVQLFASLPNSLSISFTYMLRVVLFCSAFVFVVVRIRFATSLIPNRMDWESQNDNKKLLKPCTLVRVHECVNFWNYHRVVRQQEKYKYWQNMNTIRAQIVRKGWSSIVTVVK